jgi:hypothetical protein
MDYLLGGLRTVSKRRLLHSRAVMEEEKNVIQLFTMQWFITRKNMKYSNLPASLPTIDRMSWLDYHIS